MSERTRNCISEHAKIFTHNVCFLPRAISSRSVGMTLLSSLCDRRPRWGGTNEPNIRRALSILNEYKCTYVCENRLWFDANDNATCPGGVLVCRNALFYGRVLRPRRDASIPAPPATINSQVAGSGTSVGGGFCSTAVLCTPTVKPFQFSLVRLRQVSVSNASVKRMTPCGSPLPISRYSVLPPPRSTTGLVTRPQPQYPQLLLPGAGASRPAPKLRISKSWFRTPRYTQLDRPVPGQRNSRSHSMS